MALRMKDHEDIDQGNDRMKAFIRKTPGSSFMGQSQPEPIEATNGHSDRDTTVTARWAATKEP